MADNPDKKGGLLWQTGVRTVGGLQALINGLCVGGSAAVVVETGGLAAAPALAAGAFCADQFQAGVRTFLSGEFTPTATAGVAVDVCQMGGLSPGTSQWCGLPADVLAGGAASKVAAAGLTKVLGKAGAVDDIVGATDDVVGATDDVLVQTADEVPVGGAPAGGGAAPGVQVTAAEAASAAAAEKTLKELAIQSWKLEGPDALVKVVPAGASGEAVTGYVTQLKYIAGRTPAEMEQVLGLKPGMLKDGASITAPTRLPTAAEFNLRGYTQLPGGKPFVPGTEWPPGLGAPQWQLVAPIEGRSLGSIAPGAPFKP